MNMSNVSQEYCALPLLLRILLVLLLTSPFSNASKKRHSPIIKSGVFLSPKFEVKPGSAKIKYFYDIKFPRGHVAIKSLSAEIVDGGGNPIPLHETYVHHWVFIRYHKRKNVSDTEYPNRWIFPHKDYVLKRNNGMCQKDVIAQFFGLGSETRGTRTDIPDNYGIEIGNPGEIPEGFEEKWMLNVHAIDTRGVEDKMGCTECRCNLYNVTKTDNGVPLKPSYKGGFLCCYDNTQCKLKRGFEGEKRSLFLKYRVKWVEWDHYNSVLPLDVYILDVTDERGVSSEHNCKVEYEVEACKNRTEGEGCVDVRRTSIRMRSGGYLIYGVAHQHSGALGSTLYGQDGRVLCTSKPKYGEGEEVGNEKGYVVGMSACYPKAGSVKIEDDEALIVESNYSTIHRRRTGVMSNFYLLLSKHLPHQPFTKSS